MAKHDLSDGWVVIRDPKQVPERLRRPLVNRSPRAVKLAEQGLDSLEIADIEFFSEFNDLLVLALVAEWSYAPVVTLDGLLDLPANSYDELRQIVAPLAAAIMPDFSPTDNPDSPTQPSDA